MAKLLLTATLWISSVFAYHEMPQKYVGKSDSAKAEAAHWTYYGNYGPLLWAKQDGNSLCATGEYQSPINIPPTASTSLRPYMFPVQYWTPTYSVTAENNGHTIQVNVPKQVLLTNIGGSNTYYLDQFHFHTPSEHLLNGEHYPMEVHLVHYPMPGSSATGALVIGIMFELSTTQTTNFLSDIVLKALPYLQGAPSKIDIPLSMVEFYGAIMNDKNVIYSYPGSLTTPPCTQGINWFVARNPFPITVLQHNEMKRVMKFNSRYPQADYVPNGGNRTNLLALACSPKGH